MLACSAHSASPADVMSGEKISGEEAEEGVHFKSKHVRVRSETKRV